MRLLPVFLSVLAGCSEYSFGKPSDAEGPSRPSPSEEGALGSEEEAADTGEGGQEGGEESWADSGGAPPDEEHPEDTGSSVPPDDEDDEPEPDWSACTDGYWADYYNIPAMHPDMESGVTGVTTGDVPANHDWWDNTWFAFRQVDPGLDFGEDWWPVDEGLAGDPQYFAVRWVARLDVASTGTYSFEMGSDDDGWAYVDGNLVADLGGIHGVAVTNFDVTLDAGVHDLELFMAERHTSQSGFWFRWNTDQISIYACP